MGSNHGRRLPPGLAPTSHPAIVGSRPASTSIIAANGQNDDDLLHPKPRRSIPSKKDQKIQDHIKRTGAPTWEPGTLIRLLPDAVHVKIDSIKEISLSTPPPPVIPHRLTIALTSQSALVGQMTDERLHRYWYEGTTSRRWDSALHADLTGGATMLRLRVCERRRSRRAGLCRVENTIQHT